MFLIVAAVPLMWWRLPARMRVERAVTPRIFYPQDADEESTFLTGSSATLNVENKSLLARMRVMWPHKEKNAENVPITRTDASFCSLIRTQISAKSRNERPSNLPLSRLPALAQVIELFAVPLLRNYPHLMRVHLAMSPALDCPR